MGKLNKTRVGANISSVNADSVLPVYPWTRSLSLGGTDETIDLGAVLDTDGTSAFTFSLWVKPGSLAATQGLISKLEAGAPNAGYEMAIRTTGKVEFVIANNYGTNYARRQGGASLVTGTWYHIIFTYDGSQGVTGLKWYINNVEDTVYTDLADTLSLTSTSDANLYIGSRENSALFTTAVFKDVAYWPSVISSAVRTEVYRSGGRANLRAITVQPTHLWRCGDSSGDDATATTGIIKDTGSTGGFDGTPVATEAGDIVIDAP